VKRKSLTSFQKKNCKSFDQNLAGLDELEIIIYEQLAFIVCMDSSSFKIQVRYIIFIYTKR